MGREKPLETHQARVSRRSVMSEHDQIRNNSDLGTWLPVLLHISRGWNAYFFHH